MTVSINVRIKAVRMALKLSQRAFCKGIFLSHSFYAQIESGTRKANERVYELISTKYNVNKDWLLTGKGEMFSGPAPDIELEQLIEIYKELDPLFREYIMLQIKQLLNIQKRNKKAENKELKKS
ncbi:MAG: helix-turn-helix domain-containing protein [Treponema sp.]|jgi:transcriptional regulator with XRE-family HTH domain|nr:helix-turn-helix domain-containing protein [Treponema sp.]